MKQIKTPGNKRPYVILILSEILLNGLTLMLISVWPTTILYGRLV